MAKINLLPWRAERRREREREFYAMLGAAALAAVAAVFLWWYWMGMRLDNQDARNVELSADSLRAVLSDLAEKGNVERIHVIAHSMGNRALAGALAKIGNDVPVRQIALVAPDIDREGGEFRRAPHARRLDVSQDRSALIVQIRF